MSTNPIVAFPLLLKKSPKRITFYSITDDDMRLKLHQLGKHLFVNCLLEKREFCGRQFEATCISFFKLYKQFAARVVMCKHQYFCASAD